VVARPGGTARTSSDYQYQLLKCNCDMLKIIQLGLCFCDAEGRIHPGTCTWQFNFSFSLSSDMYAQDSIDLLSKSGIDFAQHEKNGISPQDFGEWLLTSGIVLNEEVKWISFHSGFDFGYLLKILTAAPLPSREDDFFAQLQLYFPCIYDIKVMMESCANLHGGLSKIAELLHVMRIGPQHQAGSDSLLTAATFFKMRQSYFNAQTNPTWSETEANRNAVRREQRLASTAALGQQLAAQPGAPSYSVITNTDSLSAFDHKFLGVLYGLNNDYTENWKKKAEREKKKRIKREADLVAALANAGAGSSGAAAAAAVAAADDSDDEEEWLAHEGLSSHQHHHHQHHHAGHHKGGGGGTSNSSSSNSLAASPSFRPQSSYGGPQPSHLTMTPTKSSSSSHGGYYASPQHGGGGGSGDYGHHHHSKGGGGVTKNNTPLHAAHRSRYSIDNNS
jgi:CCR4-NOT transcription complex subunit 7/8